MPSTCRHTSTRSGASITCHASQATDTGMFLAMPEEIFRRRVRHRVVHQEGRTRRAARRLAVRMTRLYLVRHGRAAAGWNTDADPGLDLIGQGQAETLAEQLADAGPLLIESSPLRRCRETAAPLALLWDRPIAIEPRMAEIPSPDGVDDGRSGRVAARGDAGHLVRSRPALHGVPRRGRCLAAVAHVATPSCSATSSRSTPRSAWRSVTIGWSSAASTTARSPSSMCSTADCTWSRAATKPTRSSAETCPGGADRRDSLPPAAADSHGRLPA